MKHIQKVASAYKYKQNLLKQKQLLIVFNKVSLFNLVNRKIE